MGDLNKILIPFPSRQLFKCLFIRLSMLILLPITSYAQNKAKSNEGISKNRPVVACNYTCMAVIKVRVVDKAGKRVTNLTRNSFVLYDNGIEQQVESLRVLEPHEIDNTKAQYELAYTPPDESLDGKRRQIRVKARTFDGKELRVQVFPNSYVREKTDKP
jgi:hypothetical protein